MPEPEAAVTESSPVRSSASGWSLFMFLNLMIFTIALSSKLSGRKTIETEDQEIDDQHHYQRRTEEEEEEEDEFDHEPMRVETQFPDFQEYQEHGNPGKTRSKMSPPPFSPGLNPFSMYGTENGVGTEAHEKFEKPREQEQFVKPKYVRRVKSDMKPPSSKLRKTWSMRPDYGRHGAAEEEEEDIDSVEKRRPATAREWKGDEGVDARADDFINRFKQQLKLQRMDSARYKQKAGKLF